VGAADAVAPTLTKYSRAVPAYDYRCRTCETTFEVRCGMDQDALPVSCPRGHDDVARVASEVNAGGLPDGCCGEGCCG
jgi:putative FmdB family regulatory protein